MNLQFTNNEINNDRLIEVLGKLSKIFNQLEIDFYVIGATARDLVLQKLADTSSRRKTKDLDLAIALYSWEYFNQIKNELIDDGFRKEEKEMQRFYYKDYAIDIVPFGDIAKNDEIYWPPEETIALSVRGFNDVFKDVITVNVDDQISFKVASLHGLFILKLNAWASRNLETTKDADDMIFIMDNYYDANFLRFQKDEFEKYSDDPCYKKALDDFDMFMLGVCWLAYDIVDLLDAKTLCYFRGIIEQEYKMKYESRLAEHLLRNTYTVNIEQVLEAFSAFSEIFSSKK